MTATLPDAATLPMNLVATHQCVVCLDLPERPFDKADVDPAQDYRPRKPAAITSGKTKRSFRCLRHTRAKKKELSARTRAYDKTRRFGLSPQMQLALWMLQGAACPCGRKRSLDGVPPGVAIDHDRTLAREHDHPDEVGCLDCVSGFLCMSCNRDVVGRLERSFRGDRERIALALAALADQLINPPMRRLLAERPDLKELSA
jgi:hypothetical protein